MVEVLWHGRGGQGAFTAAKLLGAAASISGRAHSLAFPSFGPERRGAPMRAFTKFDTSIIGDRSEIKKADLVVYLDETLFSAGWEDELKEGGRVLLNSTRQIRDNRVISIDASGIATEILGRDIPNTVFVGLIAHLAEGIEVEDAKRAIKEYMPEKLVEKNLAVIDAAIAYEGAGKQVGDENQESTSVALSDTANSDERQSCLIPKLEESMPDVDEFCHATCWDAGYLTTRNAGWRTYVPIVDNEKCTGCMKCYMDCPDGCIFKVDEEGRSVAVDLDFCKGCGVCYRACKFDAILMEKDE